MINQQGIMRNEELAMSKQAGKEAADEVWYKTICCLSNY
jgi:hypothetical protein